jgi:serine/threonine-protein kinase
MDSLSDGPPRSTHGPPFGGRYQPKRQLGGGGMAEVFLAEDLVLGRLVAVKVLRSELARDDEFVARFDAEARAVASLSHPNIVGIHDRGLSDGRWYLVMEYVPGETLKQCLRRQGPSSPGRASSIAVDILGALQAAHERGIVHRDVKPQNVLLGDDGRVKVADFGIARVGASALTRTGMMLGTSHYLSPEQARGLVADPRSDVYGAAVLLYEMLTGRVPFEGDNEVAIAWQHIHEEPPRPRAVEPSVPQALEEVVLRALAKDPDDRFQTAAEFATALIAASSAPARPDGDGGTGAAVQDEMGEPLASALVGEGDGAEAGAGAGRAGAAAAGRAAAAAAGALAVTAVAPQAAPATFDATVAVAEAATAVAGDAGRMPGDAVSAAATAVAAAAGPVPGASATATASGRRRARRWIAGFLIVLAAAVAGAGLWLSLLPAPPTVPDLVGQAEGAARAAVHDEGLRVVTRREYVDGVPAGVVSRQRPRARAEVAEGSRVEMWVSRGPVHLPAPDLRRLSGTAAEARLVDADLVPSRRNARSESVALGLVFRQEPAAGERIARGATVTYWVSTGLPRVRVPDLVGLSSSEASRVLGDLGLSANIDLTFGWGEYPDTVVGQEPAAGAKLEQGAEVTISVAVF